MPDSSSLVSFFVLAVIGWVIYKIYIWPFYISPLRNIPGPSSTNPFFGNIATIITKKSSQLEWAQKYGSIVKFYGVFNKPALLITDEKIINEIMTSYDYIKPLELFNSTIEKIGKGLVFVEGDDHKRQRKMMNPAFTHDNIKGMVPTFVQVASTLKDLIKNKVKSGEFNIDLSHYISNSTLDSIGIVAFDYEINSLTSSRNELAEAYHSLMSSPKKPILRFAIGILSNYIPFVRKIPIDVNKEFADACAAVDRVANKLMEEKYNKAKKGELKGNDLLSLLINTNNTLPIEEKLSDKELKYQILTFLLTGHETIGAAACWALYLLAQHPHEQDLLREELVKAFPDKSEFNPTFDEINSLEYLNCVVKETLRLHPPAVLVTRTNTKDEVFGEYIIPKGTTIFIPISALHKMPEIWGPTADDFYPKRWLDPSMIKNVSNLNYLPFNAGVRTCIGKKLALTECKILLSTLIRNFVFQPIEGLQIKEKIDISVNKPCPYLGLKVSKVEG